MVLADAADLQVLAAGGAEALLGEGPQEGRRRPAAVAFRKEAHLPRDEGRYAAAVAAQNLHALRVGVSVGLRRRGYGQEGQQKQKVGSDLHFSSLHDDLQ
jgi:hypothetical protein